MAVARGTYIAATLARAGWDVVPAAAGARYPELVRRRSGVGAPPSASCSRRSRTRFARATCASWRSRRGKPVHLVDGEMTSWYGPRAIAGMRYLARLRREIAAAAGASRADACRPKAASRRAVAPTAARAGPP